jgi:hypothetical protein
MDSGANSQLIRAKNINNLILKIQKNLGYVNNLDKTRWFVMQFY